jgi:hypothetical protein
LGSIPCTEKKEKEKKGKEKVEEKGKRERREGTKGKKEMMHVNSENHVVGPLPSPRGQGNLPTSREVAWEEGQEYTQA